MRWVLLQRRHLERSLSWGLGWPEENQLQLSHVRATCPPMLHMLWQVLEFAQPDIAKEIWKEVQWPAVKVTPFWFSGWVEVTSRHCERNKLVAAICNVLIMRIGTFPFFFFFPYVIFSILLLLLVFFLLFLYFSFSLFCLFSSFFLSFSSLPSDPCCQFHSWSFAWGWRQHREQCQLLERGLWEAVALMQHCHSAGKDKGLSLARFIWQELECERPVVHQPFEWSVRRLQSGFSGSWAMISSDEKFGLTAERTASCTESWHSQERQVDNPSWKGRLWEIWWTHRGKSDRLVGEHRGFSGQARHPCS